jgi:hypothetical protein
MNLRRYIMDSSAPVPITPGAFAAAGAKVGRCRFTL